MKTSTLLTKFLAIVLLALLTAATTISAATFTVTNTKDSGAGSLRQAVLDANAAAGVDTIVFDSSFNTAKTITLTGGEIVFADSVNSNVTITGPGANLLTVSGNNASRIFAILATPVVTISGITLSGGNGVGPAIFSGLGGAIANEGNLTLNSMVITDNSVPETGGGIYVGSGTLNVNNCAITNNFTAGGGTSGGGGIYASSDSTMTVTNSTISGNEARTNSASGGGIYTSAPTTITNSTINSNTAGGLGGGIRTTNFITITGSTISGNSAVLDGGGIHTPNGLTMTNSTVSGNSSGNLGGGVFRAGTAAPGISITFSTIVNNTATLAGGGINSGSTSIGNTIIANNTAGQTGADYNGTLNSQGFNLIEDIDGTFITGDTMGNITGLDPNLGPLQDNGGPTETHSLLAGSPAIDQGDSSGATTDQRGFIRPIDDPDVADAEGGDGSDIGAFESSSEPAVVPGQLLNISTRLQVLTGDQVLIGGFIVTGTDPKMVILRAIGPALIDFGISDALADPVLELHAADGSLIMSNDNWKMDQQSEIEMTGLAPTKELESAILATLDPGAYTAIVSGKNGGTGIGLVEVYDLDGTAASELANISTRGFVETGNNVMIGGFILGGDTGTFSVLIRAIGPTLTDFGVAGALEDPTLELHDAQGALISSNDNWMDDQQDEIEATGLAPQDELESAILKTLAPGAYTAIVAGQSDGTGIGLVEVYRLQ